MHFFRETGDIHQWGGANQIAIFATMENIKLDVHSHGIPCQSYEFDSNDKQHNTTISVLCCNINRWGAQAIHYDLLLPMKEETHQHTSFTYTFFEHHEAFNNTCNWEANITSNYIRRRGKEEVERGTPITTFNVSGSLQDFEWILENTEDHLVLIQEH
eukprot:1247205-Heterocapsa_arctica.AAC.1